MNSSIFRSRHIFIQKRLYKNPQKDYNTVALAVAVAVAVHNLFPGVTEAMVYLNDVELIKQCQQGDQEAFRELVHRYQEKVIWIAYQMIGNYEESRDISQEAFIRVYRSIANFNLMSNFYTWLYRISVNLCIDFLRRQKPTHRAISFEDVGDIDSLKLPPDKILEQKELSKEIHDVLQKLPHQYRIIIILRDIEGFSCKEISKIVGCNSNTVRWRLFRARQLFKDLW